MHVLVYGSNGWIGGQFIEVLKQQNVSFSCGKSRVDNETELREEIDSIDPKPSHIVSFIGRTHGKIADQVYTTIDYLEKDGKLIENIIVASKKVLGIYQFKSFFVTEIESVNIVS